MFFKNELMKLSFHTSLNTGLNLKMRNRPLDLKTEIMVLKF